MAKKTEEQVIELKPINPQIVTVHIVGDTDLVLNKMNDVTAKALIDARKDKAKSTEKPNTWEEVITAIHWLNPLGANYDYSEKGLEQALKENAPCLSAFGLKKSFGDAVVRNEVAQYSTKFMASVNIIGEGDNLVPVQFVQHYIDEKLMSPKKGAPVLVRLNRFSGWSADIKISFIDNVYSAEQIINIINLAGFGLGIGSGRSSGYGRYHVDGVK